MRVGYIESEVTQRLIEINNARAQPLRQAISRAERNEAIVKGIYDGRWAASASIVMAVNLADIFQEKMLEVGIIGAGYMGLRYLKTKVAARKSSLEDELRFMTRDRSWVGRDCADLIAGLRDGHRTITQSVWPDFATSRRVQTALRELGSVQVERVERHGSPQVLLRVVNLQGGSQFNMEFDMAAHSPRTAEVFWSDADGVERATYFQFHPISEPKTKNKSRSKYGRRFGQALLHSVGIATDPDQTDLADVGTFDFSHGTFRVGYRHSFQMPTHVPHAISTPISTSGEGEDRPNPLRRRKQNGGEPANKMETVGDRMLFPGQASKLLETDYKPDLDILDSYTESKRNLYTHISELAGETAVLAVNYIRDHNAGALQRGFAMPVLIRNVYHLPQRESNAREGGPFFRFLSRKNLVLWPQYKGTDHHMKFTLAGGLADALYCKASVNSRLKGAARSKEQQYDFLLDTTRIACYDLLHHEYDRYLQSGRFDELLVEYLMIVIGQFEQ